MDFLSGNEWVGGLFGFRLGFGSSNWGWFWDFVVLRREWWMVAEWGLEKRKKTRIGHLMVLDTQNLNPPRDFMSSGGDEDGGGLVGS